MESLNFIFLSSVIFIFTAFCMPQLCIEGVHWREFIYHFFRFDIINKTTATTTKSEIA